MNLPRTRDRRAHQKAQRRSEILDAAIELWAINGSRGTGITAVAERAGMTHAGLLHHFGSKANLLLAVIAERDARDRAILDEYFAHDDLPALWMNWADVARANESQPGLGQLFIVLLAESLDADAVGHDYFRQRYQGLVARLERLSALAQRRGQMDPEVDVTRLAGEIVAFMDGALIQWLLNPVPGDLVARYELYFDALAHRVKLQLPTQ